MRMIPIRSCRSCPHWRSSLSDSSKGRCSHSQTKEEFANPYTIRDSNIPDLCPLPKYTGVAITEEESAFFDHLEVSKLPEVVALYKDAKELLESGGELDKLSAEQIVAVHLFNAFVAGIKFSLGVG